MKNTSLVFPNPDSLIDFLLIYKVGGIKANSADLTICGNLRKKLITTAITEYGAEIIKIHAYQME